MHHLEKITVKLVAKLSPWLAPVPSAFFVARASLAHLACPWRWPWWWPSSWRPWV